MLIVTNAWNQRGWDFNDHLMGDRIANMIGRSYRDFASLRRVAKKLSESFPMVEYHDGHRRYSYDGSPNLPGRHVVTVKELGTLSEHGDG